MKRSLALVLALALVLTLLPGCGRKKVMKVYCDGDLIRPSLIEDFTEETGIEVEYYTSAHAWNNTKEVGHEEDGSASSALSETAPEALPLFDVLHQRVLDYEAALETAKKPEKVKPADPVYDLVFTSGSVIGQLVEAGLVQELDPSLLEHTDLIDPEYRNCGYDPDGSHSVTTLWQTMGLLYNSVDMDQPVYSWDALWDGDNAGKLLLPRTAEDAMAVALTKQGYGVNTADADQLAEAWGSLSEAADLSDGRTNADGFAKMVDGTAWLMPAYSGDALTLMGENSDLSFAIPREGTWRVSYGYCITEGSPFTEDAYAFLNYMTKVENLAKNAIYCKYSVTSAQALAKMDSDWRSNPLAYPDQEILAGTELLLHRSGENWDGYAAKWEDR